MGVSPEKLGSEASVCPLDILWRTLVSRGVWCRRAIGDLVRALVRTEPWC